MFKKMQESKSKKKTKRMVILILLTVVLTILITMLVTRKVYFIQYVLKDGNNTESFIVLKVNDKNVYIENKTLKISSENSMLRKEESFVPYQMSAEEKLEKEFAEYSFLNWQRMKNAELYHVNIDFSDEKIVASVIRGSDNVYLRNKFYELNERQQYGTVIHEYIHLLLGDETTKSYTGVEETLARYYEINFSSINTTEDMSEKDLRRSYPYASLIQKYSEEEIFYGIYTGTLEETLATKLSESEIKELLQQFDDFYFTNQEAQTDSDLIHLNKINEILSTI